MAASNKHIEKYLDYYLNNVPKPDYAVLISGGWGSGKTYFIKHYLNYKKSINNPLTKEKRFVVYVSLFGATSSEEIDKRIYDELHPFLSNPDVKLLTNTVKAGFKLAAFINAGKGASDLIGEAFKLSDTLVKKISNRKSFVVIFDDVERADISLPVLLGYINLYVEHLNIHSVLLADKSVWEEAKVAQADKSTLHKFSSVQEKVIGQTLTVATTTKEVLDLWLDSSAGDRSPFSDKVREFLSPHKELLCQAVENSRRTNFRVLKHAIENFGRMKDLIDEKYWKDNKEFPAYFLRVFFAFEIEYRLGKLKNTDELDVNIDVLAAMKIMKNESEKPEPHSLKNLIDRYDLQYDFIFTSTIWRKWLVSGWGNAALFNEQISSCIYFKKDENAYVQKLMEWNLLGGKESQSLFDEIDLKLNKNEVTSPSQILLVYDCLVWLEREKVNLKTILKKEKTVHNRLLEYLKELLSKQLLADGAIFYDDDILKYKNANTVDFTEFVNHLTEAVKNIRKSKNKERTSKFLDTMKSDPEKAARAIKLYKDNHPKTNVPLFSVIDPDEFVDTYLEIENPEKRVIYTAIKHRYITPDFHHWIRAELPFLERVSSKCKAIQENAKIKVEMSSDIYNLKFLEREVDAAIEKVRKMESKEVSKGESNSEIGDGDTDV